MDNNNTSFDVIVVGGGLSGLSACWALRKDGMSVVCLEALDRVGGRTYTKQHETYGSIDVGGSYVGPSQTNILCLAKELGVKTEKIYAEGDYIHYSGNKPLRYNGEWPYWNPICWLDANNFFRLLDQMAAQVPYDVPWLAPRAEEWDRLTFQNFIDQHCWTKACREWAAYFVRSVATAEPCEVSLLWILWYLHSAGGLKSIWEVADAGQEMQFIGGSQQISQMLAEKLKGSVILNSLVYKIEQSDERVAVFTPSQTYFAAHVIVAIPPPRKAAIQFSPALPELQCQAFQRFPMGCCIKMHFYYSNPFWQKFGSRRPKPQTSGISHQ